MTVALLVPLQEELGAPLRPPVPAGWLPRELLRANEQFFRDAHASIRSIKAPPVAFSALFFLHSSTRRPPAQLSRAPSLSSFSGQQLLLAGPGLCSFFSLLASQGVPRLD